MKGSEIKRIKKHLSVTNLTLQRIHSKECRHSSLTKMSMVLEVTRVLRLEAVAPILLIKMEVLAIILALL